MAENITVVMSKGDLQPLANDIKTLNGLSQSDLVTLNEMEEAVKDANDAIDSQENLIAQISAALEGKTGGGSGGTAVETCTIQAPNTWGDDGTYCATVYKNGIIQAEVGEWNPSEINVDLISNVVCGTCFALSTGSAINTYWLDNVTLLHHNQQNIFLQAPLNAGEVGKVTVTKDM